MKKIILVVSILMLLFPTVTAVQVNMIPSETEVDKGDTFSVEIILNPEGEQITTWAINTLTYSNADITSVTVNDTWKANGFWDVTEIDNEKHEATDIGAFVTTHINYTIELCTINFKSTNKGECKVEIEKGYLRNKNNDNFDLAEFVSINIKDDSGGGNGGSPPYVPPPKNKPPVADFTIEGNLTTNHTIYFNSTSTDSDGEIEQYKWTVFDDTSEIYEKDITMNFSVPFNYSISLMVTDDDGASDTITKIVNIKTEQVFVPNQDNDTNQTEPPQNNTNQTNNVTKDDDAVIISYGPLAILLIAIVLCIGLAIKYYMSVKE